jgi:hypothetical protein
MGLKLGSCGSRSEITGSNEMWRWRWIEKIIWADRVRNEILHRVREDRNILHTTKRRKANWTGHILRRNCLLKHVIEGKIEIMIKVAGRRRRSRKQLLDELNKTKRYWILKEEARDLTVWRTGYGRVCEQS